MTVMNEPKTDTKEQMKTTIYCVASCAYSLKAGGRFGIKAKATSNTKLGNAA